MTDEQFAKLPKWARREFETLRAKLRHAEEINRSNLAEYDPEMPTYGDYDEGLRGRSLPCRKVWFRSVGLEVRVGDKGGIYISGDGQLSIEPHVSNAVTVRSNHVDERP